MFEPLRRMSPMFLQPPTLGFILKLLLEILETYAGSVQVLLLEYAVSSSFRGLLEWGSPGCSCDELFRHVLQKIVPYFEISKTERNQMVIGSTNWQIERVSFLQLCVCNLVRQE